MLKTAQIIISNTILKNVSLFSLLSYCDDINYINIGLVSILSLFKALYKYLNTTNRNV